MKIAFIGGGNMAGAIIGGLLQQGSDAASLCVVDIAPQARDALARRFGITTHAAPDRDALSTECIVLAVKPQQMREVAEGLKRFVATQLVVTIAAGIRVRDLARWLGGYPRIVRAMPNTPALVGCGITGLYAPHAVGAADRGLAERVLGAVGSTLWFEHERALDAVTAVSGSGPAYVFYFIEALERAARELGLEPEAAQQLALETFAGAARLAREAGEPPARLRERVTSRGGTTERALESLEADEVGAAIVRAVRAADERSRELGDALGRDA